MKPATIQRLGNREALLYETAIKIRELIDATREQYGAADWDENDLQSRVIELVTEDEDAK